MKNLFNFPLAKWFLIVWGILCFVGMVGIAGLIAYNLGPGNRSSDKTASPHDVRFVLNWCGLGDARTKEVIHSYRSSRSFTGDHLDAHAIRLTHVEASELKKDTFGTTGWTRCDEATGVLKDAVDFIVGWLPSDEIPWFPQSEELSSAEMYVYPWSIYCHGTRPTSAKLIFVRPKDRMVFYISTKV